MKYQDVLRFRLYNQHISKNNFKTTGELVSWMGAIQAQDYAGAKWSVGLRVKNLTEVGVEKAIADRSIIRTWPMRGTLHFVAAKDARWMMSLLTPRIIAGSAGRNRQLELDNATFSKSRDLLVKEMEGGRHLMRSEVYAILEKNKISTSGQRGIHIINHLALNQMICHGPHNEKQPTYVLLDEWVPKSTELTEDEALAEIALRYFSSHGPATLHDFVWWTGLKISDARKGIMANNGVLNSSEINGDTFWHPADLPDRTPARSVHLLPGFDEYVLGYTNRSLMAEKVHLPKIVPGGNGMFMPTIVVNGLIQGLWKRIVKKDKVYIGLQPFAHLSEDTLHSIKAETEKYGRFLNKEVIITPWASEK